MHWYEDYWTNLIKASWAERLLIIITDQQDDIQMLGFILLKLNKKPFVIDQL